MVQPEVTDDGTPVISVIGGFYKSPTASQSFNYTTPIDIAWDTSCLNATNVDIYLFAVGVHPTCVHAWQSVYFSAGSYQTPLHPKWWNSTASVNLQFVITPLAPSSLSPMTLLPLAFQLSPTHPTLIILSLS